jgi:hypothetical protein
MELWEYHEKIDKETSICLLGCGKESGGHIED